MKVAKIERSGERIGIKWSAVRGETSYATSMSSTQPPSSKFRAAMDALVEPARKLLELPKSYQAGMEFRSVTMSANGPVEGITRYRAPCTCARSSPGTW